MGKCVLNTLLKTVLDDDRTRVTISHRQYLWILVLTST
jgi:hypothetical protein